MSVSNRAQISSSWCQSRQERASRDISTPSTRPTRPSPTSATSRWNPGRTSAEAPERPRSSSMTTTRSRAQPSWPARPARAYWSRVDSGWRPTCCRVDCRTWTTASRSRWRPPIFSGRVAGAIGTLLARRLSRRRRAGGIEPAPGHPADQDRQPAASVDRQPAPDRGERCRGRHGDVAAAIGPARAGRCGPRAAARSTASALQTFRGGLMEVFHKILKSGCRAEEARLRTAERLVKLIAVFCILSWRVFWMTMINRSAPQAAPGLALTTTEIGLLDRLVPDKARAGTGARTLSSYLIKVARLGGYLARARDPPPDNLAMGRGLSRLTDIALGVELARATPVCG